MIRTTRPATRLRLFGLMLCGLLLSSHAYSQFSLGEVFDELADQLDQLDQLDQTEAASEVATTVSGLISTTTQSESEEPSSSDEPHQAPLVSEEPGPSGSEAWVVQMGSFSEEANAHRLAQRVAGFGFNARVSTFNARAGPMYRVMVGPESSRERAVAIVSSLSTHGFVAQVVGQD